MGQDIATDGGKVATATASSLAVAEKLGVTSIVFPALGTGIGGLPMTDCARIMISEVPRHTAAQSVIERVVFVLFDETARRVFREELDRKSSA